MECWNAGSLVFKRIFSIFNFIFGTNVTINPLFHYSIIPSFQLGLPARALQWQAGRNL
jgi:hypothetical protein